MGVKLVQVAVGPTWAHLSHPARVLFVYMAATALDDDKPPRYFAGRDPLVQALYGNLADDPEQRDKQYRYVRKLIKEIKDAGGLVLLNAGQIYARKQGRGGQAEYAVRVFPGPRVEVRTVPPVEEPTVPPTGGTDSSPSGGTDSSPSGGTESVKVEEPTVPPKEKEEQGLGIRTGDRTSVPAQTYVVAREGRNGSESSPDTKCLTCGRDEPGHRAYARKPDRDHPFTPDPGPRLIRQCIRAGCTRKGTEQGPCWNHLDEQGRLRHHAAKATSVGLAS